MTEENNNYGSENSVEATPGVMLKQAREAQGLQIEEIAEKLYLKPSLIAALENNELDNSKSITFTKGYVKNYAKLVGIDIDEIVTLFERFHNGPENTAKLQSFSKRVAQQAHDDRWMMVTYLILLIIVGGVVWWWLQQPASSVGEVANPESNTTQQTEPVEKPVEQEDMQSSSNLEPIQNDGTESSEASLQNQASTTDLVTTTSSDLVSDSDTTEPAIIEEASDISELPNPADIEPETVAIEETTTIAAEAESTRIPVVFTFTEDCWVNIVDSTGEAIAYGVKDAGYVMEIEGIPPFEVTLGQPQVVSIVYNGEPVDMSGFDGNQIARLVLPQQD